jgi:AraC-like DNA-binding protein
MLLLSDIFSLLAISPLFIMGCLLAFQYENRLGRLNSLLCFLLIGYLAGNFQVFQVGDFSDLVFGLMAIYIPAVLWLIAFYLFCDNEKIGPIVWVIVIGYLLLRVSGILVFDQEMRTEVLAYLLFFTVPQIVMLGLSLHAIYLAMRDYGSDLIEHRRQARVVFVVCVAVLIFIVVGYGFVSQVGRLTDPALVVINNPVVRAFFSFYILAFSVVYSLTAFQLRHQIQELVAEPNQLRTRSNINQQRMSKSDQELITRVVHAMENEKAYATTGITISSFAKMLGVQEYRLRRAINSNLNYRNFNQLLNHYRTQDASSRLTESNDSISRIALEVGYASISPFNTAFKSRYGKTPTEFRLSE